MYKLAINFPSNESVYDLAVEQCHKLYRAVYQLPEDAVVEASGLISGFDDVPKFFKDKTTIRFINEFVVVVYVVLENGKPVEVYVEGTPVKENEHVLVHITKTISELNQIGTLMLVESE